MLEIPKAFPLQRGPQGRARQLEKWKDCGVGRKWAISSQHARKFHQQQLLDASGYQNGLSKLLFRHTDCGHTFRMAWNYFQSGCRCPWCAKNSPGEIAILRFLEANGVEYEPEYWFEDLRVQRPLRFDFKVTLRDGRIGLVEYDGFYHYGKGLFGHTGQDTQKRDKMKDEYCQVNGIPLLRIGWEDYDDISRQLEHFLATGSTTIPSGSTPQAIGGGNGKHL